MVFPGVWVEHDHSLITVRLAGQFPLSAAVAPPLPDPLCNTKFVTRRFTRGSRPDVANHGAGFRRWKFSSSVPSRL